MLQADMIAWAGRMLDGLIARGIELTYMARHLNRLADAVAKRLKDMGRGEQGAVPVRDGD
ncbi:MAG TPA: hypothetical protein VNE59_14505 [Burkholderiales bacterium]|nr:hypothetical protein [Burkholderiales bacterium]